MMEWEGLLWGDRGCTETTSEGTRPVNAEGNEDGVSSE